MEVTTHRIIALLTLHSSRWRNLYLDVGADIPVRLRLFCFHGSQPTPPAGSKWWNITRSEIQHGAQGLPYVFRAQEISPDVGRYWLGQHHTCNSPTSERQRVRRGVTTTPALEYCYVSEFTKSSSDYNLERPLSIRDCTRRASRRRCNRIPKDLSKNVVLSLEEWTRNEGWMRVGFITGDNHGISSPALNLKLLPQIVELVVLRMLTQSGSGDVMDEILVRIFHSPPNQGRSTIATESRNVSPPL
ncbi:hypothetical protein M413DRAFT_277551 [Hebeloma cylindrosporum]|uniref:Uncharacterized protein n=1 Tax=Hebeloma cylindrosporum TaxID=76867 RepID=A0A0C2Y8I9_HEBCY|nr:hypothetical protein M413DRAFT_277551 [Hebeloma cylindrosporum h7]